MEPNQTGETPIEETVPETAEAEIPEAAEEAAPAEEPPAAPEEDGKSEKADKKTEKSRKKEKNEAMALKAENERLAKELAEAKDSYQRMLAEYANYKRRTEQKERLGEFTKAELLGKLLTSLDNMERAIEAPAGDDYKTGVDMVLRQFRELLMGMGLEEIEAENAPFNPEVHNAVMREDADGIEPETVTAVFQKGYKYGDRVLRPAMVKVAN